jgi:hypothetical protein
MFRLSGAEREIKRQLTLRVVGQGVREMDSTMLQFPKCAGLDFSVGSVSSTNSVTVEMTVGAAFMDQLRKDGKMTVQICLPNVAPAKLVFESRESGKGKNASGL